MPYHCTLYLVRVRNDHNLPQGRKFLFDSVVVVGGGSEGEVTQVEVVEGGEGEFGQSRNENVPQHISSSNLRP